VYEPNELLSRLRLDCGDDDIIYEALQAGIEPELSEGALKRTCINLRNQLRNYFRNKDVVDMITQAFHEVKFNKTKIGNISTFALKLHEKLAPYTTNALEKDPAVVDAVDFSKPDEVSAIFETVKESESGETILRLGIKARNRMLDGGYRRGEAVVNSALAHNFKTGQNLTDFRHIAVYNTPVLKNPGKKPCLLRISFEDSLKENFMFMYEQFYMNEHKKDPKRKLPDLTQMSKEELMEYFMPRMTATGFNVFMMRVNPSAWTYLDLQNKILELEAEGYEVIACFVDYLAMMPTTGCIPSTNGADIRDMYRRIRNFCSARHILFVTPHQLSSEARKLVRDGATNFVKMLPGKAYYDGCQRLEQEVDLEIFQHIEFVGGNAYLTTMRGKHRKTRQTPRGDHYYALKMHDVGNIIDDVDDEVDTSYKVPGASPVGTGHDRPVFSNDHLDF
jgi:hypothetical protein